jgi:biotin carboxyl carrier protein
MKTRTKAWILSIVSLLVVFGAIAGIKAAQIGAMIETGKSFAPPPEVVASAKVEAIQWRTTTRAVGTLVAVRAVALGAEIPGLVREITFDSGTPVKAGDVLVRLDTSAEQAQLTAALADALLANATLDRERSLHEENASTPANLDAAQARSKQAEANVANLRATIAKKVIRAPFDGRIAIRQVELGQILPSGAPIASLTSVSPIYAEFWMPEQWPSNSTLDYVTQPTREVHKSLMTLPESQFTFQVTFPNQGFWGLGLLPWEQRERSAFEVLGEAHTVGYTGESRQLRTEGNRFLPAFLLAVVLIFLVLAAQFNSFRDPFVILAGSVPLAMFGALTLAFLKMPNPNVPFFTAGWTTTLNVYSQVGLVTLVGLISKNGILIVEFAMKLQERGASKLDAVQEAAVTRLRPILMTSVATICGHFPLTLVSGPGAAARNSIGLVLVAGMAIGTTFTLFFVPAIYLLIARDRHGQESTAPLAGQASVA